MQNYETISKMGLKFLCLSGILFMAISSSAQQKTKPDTKVHLSITQEIEGKSIHIDTVYDASKQEEVNRYLQSKGINISDEADNEPPMPPMPPVPPLPPDAPEAPLEPESPRLGNSNKDISLHLLDLNLSKLDKENLDMEIEKLKEDLKQLERIEMPDFSKELHNIMDEMDQKQFEEEMKKLNIEMQNFKKELKNIRIEIKDEKGDEKEKSLNGKDGEDNGFTFSYSDESGLKKGPCSDGLPYKVICITNKACKSFQSDKSFGAGDSKSENRNEKKIIKIYRKHEDMSDVVTNSKQENAGREYSPSDNSNSYELAPLSFKAFPNPGNGIVNINFQLESNAPVEIKMIDEFGKLVYEERIENFSGSYDNQIDLTEKGRGVYLFSITQGSQWMHKKIIVR